VNGLGLPVSGTDRYDTQLEKVFAILPDSAGVFRNWRKLVVDYVVMGAKVHDARLVAIMNIYGIERIVAFHAGDFAGI
jgi:hypothetical protein